MDSGRRVGGWGVAPICAIFNSTMVTNKIDRSRTAEVSDDAAPRRRGRPPGRTARGQATRERLFDTAVAAMARDGFQATTLRGIAAEAGLSHVALYRYFPSKHAIVLALYDGLSRDLVEAARLPRGRWSGRVVAATRASLDTLQPHRETLRELVPLLVGRGEEGVFSGRTAFSRERVSRLFIEAVTGATDTPKAGLAEVVGRLAYLVHLAVILFWLLDVSPDRRATNGVLDLLGRGLRLAAPAIRVPGVPAMLRRADALVTEGLLAEDASRV